MIDLQDGLHWTDYRPLPEMHHTDHPRHACWGEFPAVSLRCNLEVSGALTSCLSRLERTAVSEVWGRQAVAERRQPLLLMLRDRRVQYRHLVQEHYHRSRQ